MNGPAPAGRDLPDLWIIGASGPTGTLARARLAACGRPFLACSRQPPADAGPGWQTLSLDDATAPCTASTILSFGPLDRLGQWLARIETPALRHVVALGSIGVRTKARSVSADERLVAQRLADAEAELARLATTRGFDLLLIRASMIWDGVHDGNVAPLLRFARRWWILPVPISPGGWRNPIHAADLADMLVAALDESHAGAVPIAVTEEAGGPEPLRQREILRRIARHAGAIPVPVPLMLLRWLAGLAAARYPTLGATLARWNQDQLCLPGSRAGATRFLDTTR